MKAIDDFKYKKSLKALNKMLDGFTRYQMVQNLTTARSIGIVFYLHDQTTMDEVLNLKQYFEGLNIHVQALGYYNGKEIPQYYTMHSGVDIFDKERVNWFGKPDSPIIDTFVSRNFDILVDLNFDEIITLRWISSLSKARFKVGAANYQKNPFDLIVSVDKAKGLNYLCEQVKQILYQLNNRFAQVPTTSQP